MMMAILVVAFEKAYIKRPLEDIENNKGHIIVIYKINHLTYSLLDFSQLIKILDAHNYFLFL